LIKQYIIITVRSVMGPREYSRD